MIRHVSFLTAVPEYCLSTPDYSSQLLVLTFFTILSWSFMKCRFLVITFSAFLEKAFHVETLTKLSQAQFR
jgi:hypothetical protein